MPRWSQPKCSTRQKEPAVILCVYFPWVCAASCQAALLTSWAYSSSVVSRAGAGGRLQGWRFRRFCVFLRVEKSRLGSQLKNKNKTKQKVIKIVIIPTNPSASDLRGSGGTKWNEDLYNEIFLPQAPRPVRSSGPSPGSAGPPKAAIQTQPWAASKLWMLLSPSSIPFQTAVCQKKEVSSWPSFPSSLHFSSPRLFQHRTAHCHKKTSLFSSWQWSLEALKAITSLYFVHSLSPPLALVFPCSPLFVLPLWLPHLPLKKEE